LGLSVTVLLSTALALVHDIPDFMSAYLQSL